MPACRVELGHELAVGGACCGEVLVAFAELEAHVADLLLQSVVALAKPNKCDVPGRELQSRCWRQQEQN